MVRPTNNNRCLLSAQMHFQKALQETRDPFQRDLALGLCDLVLGMPETVTQILQEIDSLKQPVKSGMMLPSRLGIK